MKQVRRLLQLQEMSPERRQAEVAAVHERSRLKFAILVKDLLAVPWSGKTAGQSYYSVVLGQYQPPGKPSHPEISHQLLAVPFAVYDGSHNYSEPTSPRQLGITVVRVTSLADFADKVSERAIPGRPDAEFDDHYLKDNLDAAYDNACAFEALVGEVMGIKAMGVQSLIPNRTETIKTIDLV